MLLDGLSLFSWPVDSIVGIQWKNSTLSDQCDHLSVSHQRHYFFISRSSLTWSTVTKQIHTPQWVSMTTLFISSKCMDAVFSASLSLPVSGRSTVATIKAVSSHCCMTLDLSIEGRVAKEKTTWIPPIEHSPYVKKRMNVTRYSVKEDVEKIFESETLHVLFRFIQFRWEKRRRDRGKNQIGGGRRFNQFGEFKHDRRSYWNHLDCSNWQHIRTKYSLLWLFHFTII